MRRVLGIISLGMFFFCGARAQGPDPVIRRLYLVGDAGEFREGHHPVCDWLKQRVDWNDTSNVLVYLGDNIYPQGMPPEGAADVDEARKILDALERTGNVHFSVEGKKIIVMAGPRQ